MTNASASSELGASAAVSAYIGLGSNLQNPAQQIEAARIAISAIREVNYLACSGLYRSPPMGPQDQPDYINAVVAITTTLEPLALLKCLQAIEQQQGRIRQTQRWVARTLDLDLLIYANELINLPTLMVPHKGIAERAFVLYPLQELAPALVIPGKGSIAELINQCPLNGLERITA